jgi:hypothetical protein
LNDHERLALSGFSLHNWLIYTDNDRNKDKKFRFKLNSQVIVKEKNHLDVAKFFYKDVIFKVPRRITEDVIIIENENSKGNI